MKRWLFLIALGVAGAVVFRWVAFEGIYIASSSMEPTLPVGTYYFVDKIGYLFRSPQRGEVIVFASPVTEEKDLVKRVVGLPGDKIFIKDKSVFLNGAPWKEPYARYKRKDEILVGDNIPELTIPDDSYFVMGDNRDESGDSRDWKNVETGKPIYFVQQEQIKGRLLNVLE